MFERCDELIFPYSPVCELPCTEYDFGSIMHYHSKAFSKSSTDVTLSAKVFCDNGQLCTFGQRETLSPLDIKDISIMYNCAEGKYMLFLISEYY